MDLSLDDTALKKVTSNGDNFRAEVRGKKPDRYVKCGVISHFMINFSYAAQCTLIFCVKLIYLLYIKFLFH